LGALEKMRFKGKHLTVSVTGGWGEKSWETENCQSSEQALKNAPSPSRPVHAVLGSAGVC
jgi:hypothetical protein